MRHRKPCPSGAALGQRALAQKTPVVGCTTHDAHDTETDAAPKCRCTLGARPSLRAKMPPPDAVGMQPRAPTQDIILPFVADARQRLVTALL